MTADNVAIDGFLVDSDGTATTVAGISLAASKAGYQVLNNVIRDNTFGLYLNDNGTPVSVVQHNLFDSNNRPGSASGDGIYSDGGLINTSINENRFTGQTSAAMVFAGTQIDISITGNDMVNDSSIVLFNTATASIFGNHWTNTTGSAVFIGGGNNTIDVQNNTFTDGSGVAVSATNTVTPANNDVRVTGNTINQDIGALHSDTPGTTSSLISLVGVGENPAMRYRETRST